MKSIRICLICVFAFLALSSFGWTQSAPLTCSPAPCVLRPTQVSQNGATDASISANPISTTSMLIGGDACGPASFRSTDGGTTWQNPVCMRLMYIYTPYINPVVGYDLNGAAYIIGDYGNNDNLSLGLIGFQKSSDGVSWGAPARVTALSPYILPDAPWLAIDTNPASSHANDLYVSVTQFSCTLSCYNATQLAVAHSTDGGATWKSTAVTPWQKLPADDEFSTMAIGADGTVYLTWQHCPATGPTGNCDQSTAYMEFSKSTDGGNTWSNPRLIAVVTLNTAAPGGCSCGDYGKLPNTNEPVRNQPVIGVDNSTGPNSGHLYVAMYNWTGSYMQVQVARSKDGGTTWSKPVPVAPATATHDQFFPWLSVSATGVVGLSWLDRRNDPANLSYQAFAAVSTDGGKTFGTNWELTSALSNPNNDGSGGTYMGDYTGNTWVGNTLYAAWMDTSNGITSQDVVGGLRLK
jgi:Neuraminidase (sialidase)